MRAYLAERGLGEEISKEFRLGLSRGSGLVAKARESGFSVEEIRAAGLANQRGNDYFPFRLMFPLADARGRIVGFQARRLRDDDPLKGKYVNTPESELFKKGNVLYGLHLARPAIAKQDRAIVVEGNTDVIALRQAGVEPVVASMGTALTEHQVRELGRLTKRPLPLLRRRRGRAGGDAARDAARGGAGVRRPRRRAAEGEDPADAPDSFAARLGNAESYLHYRVRIALERTDDRRRRSCGRARSSRRRRTRPSGRRRCACSPTGSTCRARRSRGSRRRPPARWPAHRSRPTRRLLEAGLQRERDLLAAVVRHPSLLDELAALTPDHFDDPLHRRFREVLVSRGGRGRGAGRAARRARRARRAGRARRATGRELVCSGSTSGGSAASSRAPTSCARPSSRRGSRRCTPPRRARVPLRAVVGELGERGFVDVGAAVEGFLDGSLTSLGSGLPPVPDDVGRRRVSSGPFRSSRCGRQRSS